jgi:hypothetical protein
MAFMQSYWRYIQNSSTMTMTIPYAIKELDMAFQYLGNIDTKTQFSETDSKQVLVSLEDTNILLLECTSDL